MKHLLNTTNRGPRLDLLTSGPPCQGWSPGGRGLGESDERSRVFEDVVTLAKRDTPYALIIENSDWILTRRGVAFLDRMINKLAAAGYNVHYKTLTTHVHGVLPHCRQRCFIVAFHSDRVQEAMLWPEPVEAVSHTTLLGPRNQGDDATRRPSAPAQRAAIDRAWRIADERLERNSVYISGH